MRVHGCAAPEDTGKGNHCGFAQAGPVDASFDAQHPLVNLILIPHMAASDHSVRVGVTGGTKSDATYGINTKEFEIAAAPGVADLAAHRHAGPGEDRRRRQVDRRRRAGRKVGRESRRSGESDGTNECQEDVTIDVLCPCASAKYAIAMA